MGYLDKEILEQIVHDQSLQLYNGRISSQSKQLKPNSSNLSREECKLIYGEWYDSLGAMQGGGSSFRKPTSWYDDSNLMVVSEDYFQASNLDDKIEDEATTRFTEREQKVTEDMWHINLISLKEPMKQLLKRIVNIPYFGEGWDFFCRGIGGQGIIMVDLNKRVSYKFVIDEIYSETGFEPDAELETLKILRDVYPNGTRYVVNLAEDYENDKPEDCIKLEFLEGYNLWEYSEMERINDDEMCGWARDIIYGFLELHNAGVWHHGDVRPQNMFRLEDNYGLEDEAGPKDGRVVLVDLVNSFTGKDAPPGTKRFGGPANEGNNDLISLGQTLYALKTHELLFGENETRHAKEVQDLRNHIYGNPKELLPPYLEKVNQVFTGVLRELIKFCLTSTGTEQDYNTALTILSG